MISFFDQIFTSVQEAPSNMKRKKMKHKTKSTVNKYQPVTGCLSNKWGKCKAHFPRKTFKHTEVDMDNGALNIKKGESMLQLKSHILFVAILMLQVCFLAQQ